MTAAVSLAIPRLTDYRDALRQRGALREAVIGGHGIVYADEGSGPPLVLIHGLGGSLFDWRAVSGLLVERGYRVIHLDLLGAGESAKPSDAEYSIAGHARRLRRFLDALRIDRATLVGNSLGGGIAMWVAQVWPDRVDRLVLINTVCYRCRIPTFIRLCRVPLPPEILAKVLPIELLIRANLFSSGDVGDAEARVYAQESRAPGWAEAYIRTARAIMPAELDEWESRIRTIRTPTLVLWGRRDPLLPFELAGRLASDLPDAKLFVLADAGHSPNQGCPDVVVRRIAEFVR